MKKASFTRPSPPEHVFFTDRDLGKAVPEALREAGLRVERHDDHFAVDTPDEVWLAEVGARNWIALTHNKRIRYTSFETEALMRSGVRCFVLVGRGATHAQLASFFVDAVPAICRFLEKHPGPFIGKVRRGQHVDMWLSHRAWSRHGDIGR